MSIRGKGHNVSAESAVSSDGLAHERRAVHLRTVALPAPIRGRLFLAAMPGRDTDLEADLSQMTALSVSSILCLVEHDELRRLAPAYAEACNASGAELPRVETHPIPDFGIPTDVQAYRNTVSATASRLQAGETVLIHCAAGIGRTGMTAIAVLCRLDLDEADARRRVEAAGSGPETDAQKAFLQELVRRC